MLPPPIPVDAGDSVEHDGGVGFTGKLTVGEVAPVKLAPLFWFADKWGPLTHGSHASVTAVRDWFYSFLDFVLTLENHI